MKKYILLILLFLPMAAFSAPSVRVLGNKTAGSTNTPSISTTATPAKLSATTTGGSSVSRVGTLRAKAKTPTAVNVKTGTTSNAKAGTDSRFPMIVPNHTYTSVVTPKTTGGSKVVSAEVDEDAIVDKVVKIMEEKYKNMDDPRFYTISTEDPNALLNKDAPEGWAYMWIEE